MINFSEFTSLPYWLTRNPNALSQEFLVGWAVITGALIVGGIALRYWARNNDKLMQAWVSWYFRIGSMLTTMGVFSLVALFFRYQRIPLFAARWWMLVWLLAFVVWAVFIYRKKAAVEAAIKQGHVVQRLKKYLPKRKK